ncbi:hypothetical protein ACP275_02G084100 [Erythranthe tilingii]
MRKGCRKMWWVKKSSRRESRMEIEEILKMKLETIKEETETNDANGALAEKHRSISKKVKKIQLKAKMGRIFISQLSLKESYVIFMTGFASKGGLSGLPRY